MKHYKTDRYKTPKQARPVGQCHWCGDVVMGVSKKKYCSGRCQYEFNKSRDIIKVC